MSENTPSTPVLEPEAQAFAEATANPPYLFDLGPVEGRKAVDEVQSGDIAKPVVDEEWIEVTGPGGPVHARIVKPRGTSGPLPVILYIHGAGWAFGNAHTHDRLVRELSVGTKAAVVFPEYDLSPEARYPVAIEQNFAVARWIVTGGAANGLDSSRIAVAGDSVGGLADERFQENLEAAKAYYEQHWTLCAPRSATMLDRPVGQWLSNLRRPGALDGHPEWKAALEAVDEDWNPEWPAEWQRHCAALLELMADEEGRAEVLPGFTVHGMDIGKWLARQRKPEVWEALTDGQRERLEQLGIVPLAPPEPEEPAKPSTAPLSAFERGVAAPGAVQGPRGLCEGPQGPRRAAGGRH